MIKTPRRQLIAKRVAAAADTPDGHACSNLIEQLQNYETAAPDQRARLAKLIPEQMARLADRHQYGMLMPRPANADMVEGFRDGYDLTAPEPSSNRSNSYRHGFMCGRIDRGQVASPSPAELHRMADEAMEADEPRGL